MRQHIYHIKTTASDRKIDFPPISAGNSRAHSLNFISTRVHQFNLCFMLFSRRFYFSEKADSCNHFVSFKITTNCLLFSKQAESITSTSKYSQTPIGAFYKIFWLCETKKTKSCNPPTVCIKILDTRNFQEHQKAPSPNFLAP